MGWKTPNQSGDTPLSPASLCVLPLTDTVNKTFSQVIITPPLPQKTTVKFYEFYGIFLQIWQFRIHNYFHKNYYSASTVKRQNWPVRWMVNRTLPGSATFPSLSPDDAVRLTTPKGSLLLWMVTMATEWRVLRRGDRATRKRGTGYTRVILLTLRLTYIKTYLLCINRYDIIFKCHISQYISLFPLAINIYYISY